MRQEFTSIMNAEICRFEELTLSHLRLRDQVNTECNKVNKKFTNHGITLWKLKRGLGNVYKSLKDIRSWRMATDKRMEVLQNKLDDQQIQINIRIHKLTDTITKYVDVTDRLCGIVAETDTITKYVDVTDRLCGIVAELEKRDVAECAQGAKEIKAILDYLDANMDEETCLVTARKKDKLRAERVQR